MIKKKYSVHLLVITILLSCLISSGGCIAPVSLSPGLIPVFNTINPVDTITAQNYLTGDGSVNSGDLKSSQFTSVFLNNYTDAGTALLLLGVSVLLTSLFYMNRIKKTEATLAKLIGEKEMLWFEVNERLKNTFAIISSLILMQASNALENETKQKLTEINNRVMSISVVHENLMHSKGALKVNLHEVFQILGERLFETYLLGGDISFKINGGDCYIDMNRAVPLGIVINEIISNSLKFAFEDRVSGEISMDYKCSEGIFELCVFDDGVGIPEHLVNESHDSLGINLVRNIVSLQLKGNADLRRESGTKWMINFPLEYS